MADEREAALRARIHAGMTVLAMDGDALGQVFEVGEHALALERGTFLPHEWTASFTEVERVDEQGVWLRHGRGSLERVWTHSAVPSSNTERPPRPRRSTSGPGSATGRHARGSRPSAAVVEVSAPSRRRTGPPTRRSSPGRTSVRALTPRLTPPAGPSRLAAHHGRVHARPEPQAGSAAHQGLRGVSEDGRPLGSSPPVPVVWPRRLL